jgi:hypothetical protein
MLSVHDLQEKYLKKCDKWMNTFDRILKRCSKQIESAFNNNETYTVFQVPEHLEGYSTTSYNQVYCAAYIVYKLRQGGYDVQFYDPNVVFVSWSYNWGNHVRSISDRPFDITDVHPPSPPLINNVKKLMLEPPSTPTQQYRPTIRDYMQTQPHTQYYDDGSRDVLDSLDKSIHIQPRKDPFSMSMTRPTNANTKQKENNILSIETEPFIKDAYGIIPPKKKTITLPKKKEKKTYRSILDL